MEAQLPAPTTNRVEFVGVRGFEPPTAGTQTKWGGAGAGTSREETELAVAGGLDATRLDASEGQNSRDRTREAVIIRLFAPSGRPRPRWRPQVWPVVALRKGATIRVGVARGGNHDAAH